MRTTPAENREAAKFIADKLNTSVVPLRVLLPEKGLSGLDAPGQAFYDPEADGALFEELEKCIEQTPERKVSLPSSQYILQGLGFESWPYLGLWLMR